jgi:hypothetical protein
MDLTTLCREMIKLSPVYVHSPPTHATVQVTSDPHQTPPPTPKSYVVHSSLSSIYRNHKGTWATISGKFVFHFLSNFPPPEPKFPFLFANQTRHTFSSLPETVLSVSQHFLQLTASFCCRATPPDPDDLDTTLKGSKVQGSTGGAAVVICLVPRPRALHEFFHFFSIFTK